jgi:hypothetical protein
VTGDQEPSRVAGALSRGIDDATEAYRRRLAELVSRALANMPEAVPPPPVPPRLFRPEQTPEM